MRHTIYVVLGDIGSAQDLIEIAKVLMDQGVSLEFIADPDGKAKDALNAAGFPYSERLPLAHDFPRALVCGASNTATHHVNAWTRWAQERNRSSEVSSHQIPVLWYEDMYGCSGGHVSAEIYPHALLVIDELARDIAARNHPGVASYAVGKPSFANLVPAILRHDTLRRTVREKLSLTEHDIVVLWWSGGELPEEVIVHLDVLVNVFRRLPGPYFNFLPRMHRKLDLATKQKCLERLDQSMFGQDLLDRTQTDWLTVDELNAISDVVVTLIGTEGYRALFTDKLVVSPLFPQCSIDRLMRKGYPDGLPPFVAKRAGIGVWNEHDLFDVLVQSKELHASSEAVRKTGTDFFRPLIDPASPWTAASKIIELIESLRSKR